MCWLKWTLVPGFILTPFDALCSSCADVQATRQGSVVVVCEGSNKDANDAAAVCQKVASSALAALHDDDLDRDENNFIDVRADLELVSPGGSQTCHLETFVRVFPAPTPSGQPRLS